MNRFKICLFGYALTGTSGGAVTYTRNLAKKLLDDGHEVSIVSIEPDSNSRIKGVHYHNMLSNKKAPLNFMSLLVFCFRSIGFFLKHKEYDLVHTISSRNSILVLVRIVQTITNIPFVGTILNPVKSSFLLKGFRKVICPTKKILASAGKEGEYIPFLLDLHNFSNASAYDFKDNHKLVIGVLGGANARRGFRYLVQAMADVRKAFPDVLLVMAIDFNGKEYRQDLANTMTGIESIIKQHRLENSIYITGLVDVPKFLNSIDILVYPLQTISGVVDIPPTIVEGLASGCAVISTRMGSVPEIILHNVNGVLIHEGTHNNPESYAKAIIDLIRHPGKMKKLRENGKSSIAVYDLERSFSAIFYVYESVASSIAKHSERLRQENIRPVIH